MGGMQVGSDEYDRGGMIFLAVLFMILPILAVMLRYWAKVLGQRGTGWDDYLIVAAMVFAVMCNIVQLVATVDGGLGQHQPTDSDGSPVLDDPGFVTYEKCKFAVNLLSVIGLGVSKSSILVFYMNLFRGKVFRIVSQVVLACVIVWTVSFFFSNLFICYPVSSFTEGFKHYGGNCYQAVPMWYAMAISDALTNIIILCLPIPKLFDLQSSGRQKLALCGTFFVGFMVFAFSITRAVAFQQIGDTSRFPGKDDTYYTTPSFYWSTIELSTAVLSICLPTYQPVWSYLRHRSVNGCSKAILPSFMRPSPWEGSDSSDMDVKDEITLTGQPGAQVDVDVAIPSPTARMSFPRGITVEQSFGIETRPARPYSGTKLFP